MLPRTTLTAARRATIRHRPRRHADAAVPVLSSRAVAALADRADAARGRRPHHRADRGRVPRAGSNDGATHQPGQAAHQAGGQHVRAAARAERTERLERRAARPLPDLQRGLHGAFGYGVPARSSPSEAIRLTRGVRTLLPDDGEVAGLLALMLLTDARRHARSRPGRHARSAGGAGPLAWNRDAIDEGVALVTDALSRTRLGPYQLQAAIAAVHDEAPSAAETDWGRSSGCTNCSSSWSPTRW